jgi:4-hydroxybenzoate polyprenyltransferase
MSSSGQLTLEAPLARRLLAWANERFPPANGVLILVIYAAALLCGRALTTDGPLELAPADLAGFFGVWAYFLMLRVFDEHKDFGRDVANHPDRVLQRGLVTLDHLKLIGVTALLVQVLATVVADGGVGPALGWWALTLAWSLLMLKEFFVGEWLEQRLVLYAFSHLLSMPLAFLWLAQIGAGDQGLPTAVGWLALAGGVVAGAIEVARKLRAPADERHGVDSYTKILGTTRAPALATALVLAAATASAFAVRAAGELSLPVAVGLGLATLPALAVSLRFAGGPSASRAEAAEAGVAGAVLLVMLVFAVALLVGRGVA